jgi:thiosulfate dehydrogenase
MTRAVVLALLASSGCGDETITAARHGRELLADTGLSDGSANVYACADCHEIAEGGAAGRILPGYSLVDSAFRESFWGGYERTLIEAMSFCRVWFMGGVPFQEEDEDARAILEYLVSISETDPAPMLPLTVTLDIVDVERGDAARGEAVHDAACRHCHGSPGGAPPERFRGAATPIPDDEAGWEALYDEDFPGVPFPLIVIEKIRHGRFFLVGGTMPLFSHEALSDEDLGALLAFLF